MQYAGLVRLKTSLFNFSLKALISLLIKKFALVEPFLCEIFPSETNPYSRKLKLISVVRLQPKLSKMYLHAENCA